MDYQEKVAFLRQYRDKMIEKKELEDELEALRSEAVRTTAGFSDIPRGHGNKSDRIPLAVEQIMELENELHHRIQECIRSYREIERCIGSVKNTRWKSILRYRYICGKSWEALAEEMELSSKWVKKLHDDAIRNLYIP